ncbi:MAG TPA: TIGR01777 family oxidoreductase [bacterium]|jgi:hypothetical protein
MRVLVSGSTGLIGSALMPALRAGGHGVIRLVRPGSRAGADAVVWDPASGKLDSAALEGADAAIHLAGENIAAHRWTTAEKQRIMNSRAQGTRLLCETLAALTVPPQVVVSASAIGIYGERGDDLLDESQPAGKGFLCEVVREWELATLPASRQGIRVVNLRFGIVLSPKGGSLAELLPLFRIGIGGPLAGGRQYFSWVTIQDVVRVLQFALTTDALSGPVNTVAPNPVRQRDFARVLGRVLHRPSWVDVPRAALHLRLGKELAESLLWSQRVAPRKLLDAGYSFEYPELEAGLKSLLGKSGSS